MRATELVIMLDPANADGAARAHADYASRKVAAQFRVVSSMLADDPSLSYARTVLRQMEQSAAMAQLSQALAADACDEPVRDECRNAAGTLGGRALPLATR